MKWARTFAAVLRKELLCALVSVFYVTGWQFAATSVASDLSHTDWNAFAQAQTIADALLHLAEVYDEPWETIPTSGTVSSTGWTWNTFTTYHGIPLNLTYEGTLDTQTGAMTWIGTGTYGSDPWTASGTAQFQSGDTEDTVEWGEAIQIGTSALLTLQPHSARLDQPARETIQAASPSLTQIGIIIVRPVVNALIKVALEKAIESLLDTKTTKNGQSTDKSRNNNVTIRGNGNITITGDNITIIIDRRPNGSTSGEGQTLAVELSTFTAFDTPSGIILRWRTGTETGNVGFNVYRSDAKESKYVKINNQLIMGAGTDATPHEYSFTDENVMFGKTYYYHIEDVDLTGKTNKSHIIEVTVGKPAEPSLPPPPKFALHQNYPNPFNPETWLPYQLANDSPVTISIYDPKVQLIRAIELGWKKAGLYITKDKAAYWDGKDSLGEKVASGVYFYTLQTGEFSAMRKMVILK